MTEEQILIHNKQVKARIASLHVQLGNAESQFIPPCQFCKYDGVYRCEACEDAGYLHCNIKEPFNND